MIRYAIGFALALASVGAQAIDVSPDKWSYSKDVDPFTDEIKHFAVVRARDNKGFIAVGCYSNRSFEVKVSTGAYIGDKVHSVNNVKYRIDKKEPVNTKMRPHKSMVYFNDIDNPFLRALMTGSDQVVIQILAYDYDTSLATYTLKGSTASIRAVIEACQ